MNKTYTRAVFGRRRICRGDYTRTSMTSDDDQSVDALPVLAEPAPSQSPVVAARTTHAAVVAAGGLVAGAATVAMVRRRKARKVAARRTARSKAIGSIVASRSFIVDVHLLSGGD
jgi:hypothetical protein